MYSSLGLSYRGLSMLPGLGWLFSFPMLGKFSTIISSNIFSELFCSLFSFWDPYNVNVGAFNSLIFKVVINIYDPITIFLIVLGLFCVDLFLLLCFLLREVPLAFVVQLVWWCWILLTCLERLGFLHQMWMRVLLGRIFLVSVSSLSSLNISCHPLGLIEFLLKSQLITLWEFPCMLFVIFTLLLLIF